MNSIRSLIRRHLPRSLRERLDPPFASRSYSLEGEDRVLYRILEGDGRPQGFYVDVGAHHPQRYSNTYAFYLKGWRGINIEPRPGAMDLFRRLRPRDINLEIPVADTKRILTYYEFNEPALNGFCRELALKNDGVAGYKVIGTREIETVSLAEVLDRHLPPGQLIDFLTVDVEGMDEIVLRSNDWEKYRPTVVLTEDLEFPGLSRAHESNTVRFMEQQGYELFTRTVLTLIFRLR